MMETFSDIFQSHRREIFWTLGILVFAILFRLLGTRTIRLNAELSQVREHRTKLVLRHVNNFLLFVAVTALIVVWGVDTKHILAGLSAIITVIGVAFFAQWSILSNITSGIILLISFPFRIGDLIRIHDKDFPIEAEIEDIRAFHLLLKTQNGEIVTYPNNLFLQKSVTIIKAYSEEDGYGED